MSKAYSKTALLENRIVFLRWSIAALLALALAVAAASFLEANLFARQPALLLAAPVSLILVGGMFILHRTKARLQTYRSAEQNIAKSLRASSSKIIHDLKRQLREAATRDPIIEGLLSDNISAIEQRLQAVLDAEVLDQRRQAVSARCAKARKLLLDRLEAKRVASPAIRAEQAIVEAIHQLKNLKAKAVEQLDTQRARLSLTWWFDLIRPSFNKVDERIKTLEAARQALIDSGDLEKTQAYFRALNDRAGKRVVKIEQNTLLSIPPRHQDQFDEDRILRNALLLSALSVPVSAWRDISQAESVYDSLRQVNGNYADLSNTDIWLETLTMSGPELAGLANLTKGALFENYVAADTGGKLHENFNNPDTDIVIDGVEYQIKATDNASYIDSVSGDISVIGTSEVADITNSIDGGYTNEELTLDVDLALGGTVVDFSDTALDAVLSGVGGVGIFAILSGARSGLAKYKESGQAIDALFIAVGETAKVTARSIVTVAEIVTKGTVVFGRFVGLWGKK